MKLIKIETKHENSKVKKRISSFTQWINDELRSYFQRVGLASKIFKNFIKLTKLNNVENHTFQKPDENN